MYIEQGFSPPPVDTDPPATAVDEAPRYPFTRRQKIAMRALSVYFGAEGVLGIAEGHYVASSVVIAFSAGVAAFSRLGEWRSQSSADIFDAATYDMRDSYGQPIDNRGEV